MSSRIPDSEREVFPEQADSPQDASQVVESGWDQESEGAADYATFALKRAQEIAQTQGHMRVPLRRKRRHFHPGNSEEFAQEFSPSDGTFPEKSWENGDENEFTGGAQGESAHRRALSQQEGASRGEGEATHRIDGDDEGDLTSLSRAAGRIGVGWAKLPGMAATRPRYREPRTLGFSLGRLIRRSGWDVPTRMGSVMVKWPQIVGDDVARHCEIETFEDRVLVVRCSSTAWAKQLQLLIPTIERRIAEEVGEGIVRQLIVRGPAAPSWKKGRFSVPGRGPRDTYG